MRLLSPLLIALVPISLAAQQPAGQAPSAPSPTAPKPRRSVEIRAQAPAPEVITVRPREVPKYSRRVLVPALLRPDSGFVATGHGPVIVAPAPASAEARAASPNATPSPDRRPRTP